MTKEQFEDDDLAHFEAQGAAPLPAATDQGYIEQAGARLWYRTYGAGPPVVLLHGGLGHSGNWGFQVAALVADGYRAILIDSRGHGRSTRDERPFSYELMADDAVAVMNVLGLARAALVGWSDGACTALILAGRNPSRVAGVLFFACNMDPSGVKKFEATAALDRCFARHRKDYSELSATPDSLDRFVEDVSLMQRTQPNYSAQDLRNIQVPILIVHSEADEFIKREHAEYLAMTIPNAELVILSGVTHFAPLQKPVLFNATMLRFIGKSLPR